MLVTSGTDHCIIRIVKQLVFDFRIYIFSSFFSNAVTWLELIYKYVEAAVIVIYIFTLGRLSGRNNQLYLNTFFSGFFFHKGISDILYTDLEIIVKKNLCESHENIYMSYGAKEFHDMVTHFTNDLVPAGFLYLNDFPSPTSQTE